MSVLSKDAEALLRKARGGEDPVERQAALVRFKAARSFADSSEHRAAVRLARTWTRRPLALGFGAVTLLGSLGAFAQWADALHVVSRSLIALHIWDPPRDLQPRDLQPRDLEPRDLQPRVLETMDNEVAPLSLPSAVGTLAVDLGPKPEDPGPRPKDDPPGLASSMAHSAPSEAATAGRQLGVLGAELELIVQARDALGRAEFSAARAALAAHATRYPKSTFSREHQTLVALLDCRSRGDKTLARAFVSRYPNSLFSSRINNECELQTNSMLPTPEVATHQSEVPMDGAPKGRQ